MIDQVRRGAAQRAVSRGTHFADRHRIAVDVGAAENNRQIAVFRDRQRLRCCHRRVVDRHHRDRNHCVDGVEGAVADLEAEAVRTGEVRVRVIDQVRRGAAQGAVRRRADLADCHRIAIDVGAAEHNRQIAVLRATHGLGRGHWRVVDRRHRD